MTRIRNKKAKISPLLFSCANEILSKFILHYISVEIIYKALDSHQMHEGWIEFLL